MTAPGGWRPLRSDAVASGGAGLVLTLLSAVGLGLCVTAVALALALMTGAGEQGSPPAGEALASAAE